MNALDDVCCACLPAAALPLLAGLRTLSGVRAVVEGDRVWLRWEPGHDEVLRRLLLIAGIELFARRDNLWYRPGLSLPAFTVRPESEGTTLAQLLVPARIEPEPPGRNALAPVDFRLVREEQPRPASALCCPLADLACWANRATTRQLSALKAACCGTRVLVLGTALPALPDAQRYWGERVLAPLGWRPEPFLPERSLAEALGLTADELALVDAEGIEVVPLEALTPLTRAGLRLGPNASASAGAHGQGGRYGHR